MAVGPTWLTSMVALGLGACAPAPAGRPALDMGKVSGIVVGQSSRAEVFALLGQPSRVDRGGQGESWTWVSGEAGTGRDRLGTAAQAASTVAGAFIPFAGLAGTGVGLARAMDGPAAAPAVTSFTVGFENQGIVQDCTYSTNAPLAEAAGVPAALPDCRRPAGPQ